MLSASLNKTFFHSFLPLYRTSTTPLSLFPRQCPRSCSPLLPLSQFVGRLNAWIPATRASDTDINKRNPKHDSSRLTYAAVQLFNVQGVVTHYLPPPTSRPTPLRPDLLCVSIKGACMSSIKQHICICYI